MAELFCMQKNNEQDTQRPNVDKKCVAEHFQETIDIERMPGRPIYIAYPSGQRLELTLYRG